MFSAQMGAAPGGDIKQATAVLKQRLGARPGANQAWMAKQGGGGGQVGQAGRQDLSGASPDGTIMGRGGNVQQLGRAAMARMPQQQQPVTSTFPAPEAVGMAIGEAPGQAPDMAQGPRAVTKPGVLQGDALAQAMARRGMPAGQGLPPGAAEMATRPLGGGLEGPNNAMARINPDDPNVQQFIQQMQRPRFGGQPPMERGGVGMQVDPMPLETGEMGGQATDLLSRLRGMQQAGAVPGTAAGGQNPALQVLRMRKAMGAGPGRNNPYSSLVSSALSGGLANGGMPSY